MIVSISEAKTNLSKLIDMAYHGEKIVIAKNNLPLVELVVHQPDKPRKLGPLDGELEIPEDFDAEGDAINQMFYRSE